MTRPIGVVGRLARRDAGGPAGRVRVVRVRVHEVEHAVVREVPCKGLRRSALHVAPPSRRRGSRDDHGAGVAALHAGVPLREHEEVRGPAAVLGARGDLRVQVAALVGLVPALEVAHLALVARRQVCADGLEGAPDLEVLHVRGVERLIVALGKARAGRLPDVAVAGPLGHVDHGEDRLDAGAVQRVDDGVQLGHIGRVVAGSRPRDPAPRAAARSSGRGLASTRRAACRAPSPRRWPARRRDRLTPARGGSR